MSKTKQGGSSRLGRDSAAQRLGIKITAGEKAKVGMIIIRQRGTKYLPGGRKKLSSLFRRHLRQRQPIYRRFLQDFRGGHEFRGQFFVSLVFHEIFRSLSG